MHTDDRSKDNASKVLLLDRLLDASAANDPEFLTYNVLGAVVLGILVDDNEDLANVVVNNAAELLSDRDAIDKDNYAMIAGSLAMLATKFPAAQRLVSEELQGLKDADERLTILLRYVISEPASDATMLRECERHIDRADAGSIDVLRKLLMLRNR